MCVCFAYVIYTHIILKLWKDKYIQLISHLLSVCYGPTTAKHWLLGFALKERVPGLKSLQLGEGHLQPINLTMIQQRRWKIRQRGCQRSTGHQRKRTPRPGQKASSRDGIWEGRWQSAPGYAGRHREWQQQPKRKHGTCPGAGRGQFGWSAGYRGK